MLLVTLVNQDYNEHFAMLLPSPLLSRESLFRFSLVQYVKDLFFRLVCLNRVIVKRFTAPQPGAVRHRIYIFKQQMRISEESGLF